MGTNHRRRTIFVLAAMAIAFAGCTSPRDDVTFNPYYPTGGDPSVMQSADRLMDGAEEALGDLDLRLEHAVN